MNEKDSKPVPFEQSGAIDQMTKEKEDLLVQFFSLPPDIFEIVLSFLLWTFITGVFSQGFISLREYLGDAFLLPLLPLFLLLISAAYCQQKQPDIQIDITIRLASIGLGIAFGII